jgi:Domain of unknown function (DUF4386)
MRTYRGSTITARAGGIAALYIAVAYLAAIPYFVLLVNYPGVVDPIQQVLMLRDNYASMYWMHVFSFEFVALGLIVVTLAIYQRLREVAPSTARFATVVGLIRAGLLLASVMVFNYGMGAVVRLYATAPAQAVSAWQVIEPVAQALGGSRGEILGGVWFLLISVVALRAKVFPRALNWLGVVVGTVGVLSLVPALSELESVFGLLGIVWFAWLGVVMVRTRPDAEVESLEGQGNGRDS